MPSLAPPIAASVADLRGRIRRYVWVYGLSTTAAWLGVVFWLSLIVDWFFEPAAVVRAILLAAGAASLVAVAVKTLVDRLRVRLSDVSMAMLLERRFPALDETLLTAVSLAPAADRMESLAGEMLRRTSDEAARRIGEVRPAQVLHPAPLRGSLAVAALLAASIGLVAAAAPSSLGVWARRSLLLSDELWPRRTGLAVEGFEGGVRKVARGADLTIIATADLAKPLVPKTVDVRYRTATGARGRASMNREGEAVPGRERVQRYSYTFHGVLSPIDLELSGGDVRLCDLRIEVVESPKIESLDLWCEYPKYMARSPRRIPVIGPMRIPQATRVVIHGRANKPLVRVRVDSPADREPAGLVGTEPSGDAADRRRFHYDLGPLKNDKTILITLSDVDGIESSEQTRLVLLAAADEPPELSVALSGIGTAITPQARLPVVGQVRDDYGIAEVWFQYAVGQGKPASKPLAAPRGNPTELRLADSLDVRDLDLVPGQRLLVGLKASDWCDLRPSPRVGESPRWQLEVVTPERLRAMLQARELTLRYRFEQIIQEVTETRDLLVGMTPGGRNVRPENKMDDRVGREPGDKPDDVPVGTPSESRDRLLAAASLRCERAIQNGRKNANETLGTAEAFDDLRLQLINNRIDTEELKTRLRSGIITPLRVIGEKMFPELESRLLRWRESLADPRLAPPRRDAARVQLDAILTAMNQVLGRMMEMEDFNEVITLLQEIIESQQQLEKETRRRHEASLRELLEEK